MIRIVLWKVIPSFSLWRVCQYNYKKRKANSWITKKKELGMTSMTLDSCFLSLLKEKENNLGRASLVSSFLLMARPGVFLFSFKWKKTKRKSILCEQYWPEGQWRESLLACFSFSFPWSQSISLCWSGFSLFFLLLLPDQIREMITAPKERVSRCRHHHLDHSLGWPIKHKEKKE